MATDIPHLVDYVKFTIGGLREARLDAKKCAMSNESDYTEIGDRLRAIRLAFSDLNQSEWAEMHGFNVTQWNNWERGKRRITVDAAAILVSLYGLSLDFVFLGKRHGNSESAQKRIQLHLPM